MGKNAVRREVRPPPGARLLGQRASDPKPYKTRCSTRPAGSRTCSGTSLTLAPGGRPRRPCP
eukprot:7126330-Pyramimonas_sp.AAC.1